MATKIMEWAEGWIYMQQGVTKLTTILEGLPETQFTPEEEKQDDILLQEFVKQFGMGKMDPYREDFEEHMLRETGEYYSRKASSWITEDNYSDYMSKVEESVKMEKDRVSHYLQSSSEKKLVEKVQHELVVVYATQLIEKEHFAGS
ncbi:hypothetical protein ACFX11_037990 [Malus domestica]